VKERKKTWAKGTGEGGQGAKRRADNVSVGNESQAGSYFYTIRAPSPTTAIILNHIPTPFAIRFAHCSYGIWSEMLEAIDETEQGMNLATELLNIYERRRSDFTLSDYTFLFKSLHEGAYVNKVDENYRKLRRSGLFKMAVKDVIGGWRNSGRTFSLATTRDYAECMLLLHRMNIKVRLGRGEKDGKLDGGLERSNSSIWPTTITNNLPFVASLPTAARSSPAAQDSRPQALCLQG